MATVPIIYDTTFADAGTGPYSLQIAEPTGSPALTVTVDHVPFGLVEFTDDGTNWVTVTSGETLTAQELSTLRYTPAGLGNLTDTVDYTVTDGSSVSSRIVLHDVAEDEFIAPYPVAFFSAQGPSDPHSGFGPNPDLVALDPFFGIGPPDFIGTSNTSHAGEDGGFARYEGQLFFFADYFDPNTATVVPDQLMVFSDSIYPPEPVDNGDPVTGVFQSNAHFTVFDGSLYFYGNDGNSNDLQVVKLDPDGTVSAIALNPGADSAAGHNGGFVEFDGGLYFDAVTSTTNGFAPDLIKLYGDGTITEISTRSAGNAVFGSSAGEDGGFFVYNNALYFNAVSETFGDTLFRLAAGSTTPVEVDPGLSHINGNPSAFHIFNGDLYFTALTTDGDTLVQMDSLGNLTPLTYLPLTSNEALGNAGQSGLIDYAGSLYFTASTADTGTDLFKLDSDGVTTTITALDIKPGSADSFAGEDGGFIVFNGALYFMADLSGVGSVLWRYDNHSGTAAPVDAGGGTYLFDTGEDAHFTRFGDTLLLRAITPDGDELAQINVDGTVTTYDINDDPAGNSSPGKDGGFAVFPLTTLNGTNGNDILVGCDTFDQLNGGPGNDLLEGRTFNDILTGGDGADIFKFSESGTQDSDLITDYTFSQGDTIDLSDLLPTFDPLTSNVNAFVKLFESGTDLVVAVDQDGSSSSVWSQVAILDGAFFAGTTQADITIDGNHFTVFESLPTLNVLLSSGTTSATERVATPVDPLVHLDTAVSVLASGTVDVGTNFVSGEDQLSADTTGTNITASYDSVHGILFLDGVDSVANYQTVLQTVTFTDTSHAPSTATRTIEYSLNNGAVDGDISTKQLSVIAVEEAPTPSDDTFTVGPGGSVLDAAPGVLANDTDPDGDPLTVSALDGSAGNLNTLFAGLYGHLTLRSDGSYQYNADDNVAIGGVTGTHPVDTFTYTVDDGHGETADANLIFTINRAPAAGADVAATVESAPDLNGSVVSNDTDSDGDTLTVTAAGLNSGPSGGDPSNVGGPVLGTYGTLQLNSDGSFTYSPDSAEIDAAPIGSPLSPDVFTYTVDDGHGGTAIATLTVNVDRPPTAVADTATMNAGFVNFGPSVLSNDTDRDNDSLVVSALNGDPANLNTQFAGTYGHLNLSANGLFNYAADNLTGAPTGSHLHDIFNYTADDQRGGTATTTLDITIDRAPVTTADTALTLPSGHLVGNVLSNDHDADGDTLSVSQIFAPGLPAVGSTFSTTYGHIKINSDGSYTYDADNSAAIAGATTGQPVVDVIGFGVSDGVPGSFPPISSLSITIDRVPTPVDDQASAVESGLAATGNVLGNDSDPDGDILKVSKVNGSDGVGAFLTTTYGHMTVNSNGSFTYTADNTTTIDAFASGSHPIDAVSYTVDDGHGGIATATAHLNISVDRAPTVVADTASAVESGAAASGNVLTNDSDRDGDTLTVSAVGSGGTPSFANVDHSTAGTYGHLTLHGDGTFSYLADNTTAIDGATTGSHHTDTFTYTADDGLGGTTSNSLVVTIDRAPTVVADAVSVLRFGNTSGNVLTNDGDRDGDTLAISAVAGSNANVGAPMATTYGHLTLSGNGSYSYTADNAAAIDGAAPGSHATETIAYTANDGHGGTTNANLVITIDRAPTSTFDQATALEGGSASGNVLSNDTDADGDTLAVATVGGSSANIGQSIAGSYGHLTVNSDGTFSYLADNTAAIDAAATGFPIADVFTYTATDGQGGTSLFGNLFITVDRAPTTVGDTAQAVESSAAATGNVLTNDSDRDGNALTVSVVAGSAGNVGHPTAGTYGHLTLNSDGTFSYLADNTAAIDAAATGSHLTDTFAYTASDGQGGTTSSSLVVTIDRAPTVVADTASALESGPFATGNVLTNDSDRDGDTLSVSAVNGSAANLNHSTAGQYGGLTINTDGSYHYTADNSIAINAAAAGSHPTDTFSYTADDGQGGATTTNLSISVDRASVANNDAFSTPESVTLGPGKSVFNNNGSGADSDPDGDALVVTAVMGSAGSVGHQIVLASGALLTVNADGSFSYDSNHVFDSLPGPASGASDQPATDHFDYAVNGQTAHVTVTITGQDSTGDVLHGAAGADSLTGGIGGDTFVLDQQTLADAHAATPIHDTITDYDQGNSGVFSAAEGDIIDLTAITQTAFNAGQAPGSLVRLIEDSSHTHALLQVDADGTANGTAWTTIAQLNGIHGSETVALDVGGPTPNPIQVMADYGRFGDFDNDGTSDIVWRDDTGLVGIWQMSNSSISATFFQGVPTHYELLGIGDFDGDGKSDLIWEDHSNNDILLIWQMASSTHYQSLPGFGAAPANSFLAGIGDFDGDGRSDLAWTSAIDGQLAIDTTAGATSSFNTVSQWTVVGTGDFNGDGKDDLLFHNASTGENTSWLLNGSTMSQAVFYVGVSPDWHVVGTGDFDGNGSTDVFWHNDNGANAVWLMDNTGALQQADFLTGVGSEWHVVGTGDFNHDQHDDVLWSADNGATAIWMMNGGTVQSVAFPGAGAGFASQAHHYDFI